MLPYNNKKTLGGNWAPMRKGIIVDSYSPFLVATQILLLSAVMYFFFWLQTK